MEKHGDSKEQKFLRVVDKTERKINRAVYLLFTVGYCIITLITCGMTIYYGICSFKGVEGREHFSTYLVCSILLILSIAAYRFLSKGVDRLIKREQHFDPAAMELPAAGTVTLETALHKMALKKGVIIWDTIWGTLLLIFFSLAVFFPDAKTGVILTICAILAVFLLVGHFLFSLRWKNRIFTDSLLKNTQKYISIENPSQYTAAMEDGLKKNLLYYAKELVLTEDHIIGITGSDLSFIPVALPRKDIMQLSYYEKRVVSSRYSYSLGVLKCQPMYGKPVDFLIGRGVRADRVLEALKCYGISFRKEETIYQ